jgi:hypothetical protein
MAYLLAVNGNGSEQVAVVAQRCANERSAATQLHQWRSSLVGVHHYICNVNQAFSVEYAVQRAARRRGESPPLAPEAGKSWRHAVRRGRDEQLAVIDRERAECRLTQASRLFEDGIEGGEIAG